MLKLTLNHSQSQSKTNPKKQFWSHSHPKVSLLTLRTVGLRDRMYLKSGLCSIRSAYMQLEGTTSYIKRGRG